MNTGAVGTLTDVYLHLKLHCTDNHRYTYIAASNTKSILYYMVISFQIFNQLGVSTCTFKKK